MYPKWLDHELTGLRGLYWRWRNGRESLRTDIERDIRKERTRLAKIGLDRRALNLYCAWLRVPDDMNRREAFRQYVAQGVFQFP